MGLEGRNLCAEAQRSIGSARGEDPSWVYIYIYIYIYWGYYRGYIGGLGFRVYIGVMLGLLYPYN